MVSCCVVGCAERYKKKGDVKFLRFPVQEPDRSVWRAMIRRKGWEPTHHSRVCSRHFVTGKRVRNPIHPDFAPSLHLGYENKNNSSQRVPLAWFNSARKRQLRPTMEKVDGERTENGCGIAKATAKSCAAINCPYWYGQDGVSFHRFPKNPALKQEWATAIHREEAGGGSWEPTASSVLCHIHFRPEDFEIVKRRRILKDGAVPSMFDIPLKKDAGESASTTTLPLCGGDHHTESTKDDDRAVWRTTDHDYIKTMDRPNFWRWHVHGQVEETNAVQLQQVEVCATQSEDRESHVVDDGLHPVQSEKAGPCVHGVVGTGEVVFAEEELLFPMKEEHFDPVAEKPYSNMTKSGCRKKKLIKTRKHKRRPFSRGTKLMRNPIARTAHSRSKQKNKDVIKNVPVIKQEQNRDDGEERSDSCAEGHPEFLAQKLYSMQKRGKFCDFTLRVGAKFARANELNSVKVHRVVCAGISKKIRNLDGDELWIGPNIQLFSLFRIVEFAYTGKITGMSSLLSEWDQTYHAAVGADMNECVVYLDTKKPRCGYVSCSAQSVEKAGCIMASNGANHVVYGGEYSPSMKPPDIDEYLPITDLASDIDNEISQELVDTTDTSDDESR